MIRDPLVLLSTMNPDLLNPDEGSSFYWSVELTKQGIVIMIKKIDGLDNGNPLDYHRI